MKRILHLTLKREPFDAIALEKKKTEYRIEKPYWIKRLINSDGTFRKFDEIHFRNGYTKDRPFMRIGCKAIHLGFFQGEGMFFIKLGKILEIKNWRK